jgi:hypothetical protein
MTKVLLIVAILLLIVASTVAACSDVTHHDRGCGFHAEDQPSGGHRVFHRDEHHPTRGRLADHPL